MLFNISFFQKYERKWFKMIDFDVFILEKEDNLYENYRAVAGCNN